ncbi:hypothetical protein FHR75_000255 [Kineococcus radiotolerans]|uniref:Uncharacterized protein n=1 Tax=Kineococcus radiotolerans TaxID=131568 RepID=A0A7W4TID8_KINRA|nr:hypothetical protein [Kineococcus radiotolerans]MBB2899467.1 hypothetical protein [Kineococcus radiotolerans]
MRPTPWTVRPVPTVWLDATTGQGVTDSGARVTPRLTGRRKRPTLVDLLDTAHNLSAERIMLTGKLPTAEPGRPHWLIAETPSWTSPGHWLGSPPTGRFTHDVTGRHLEVRTAAEWFPVEGLTPDQARQAWVTTTEAVKGVEDMELLKSPAATGAQLWARSLPRTLDPEPLPDDVAELLHRTSGQHRIEHLTTGPAACGCGACRPLVDLGATPRGGFAYVDGRFMYASLCRELGSGPVTRLTAAQGQELLETDPYARARYRVRFTVPEWWDHVGVLPVAHETVDAGWHYPNVPGASAETWADGVEAKIAHDNGWDVQVLEGLRFTKGRLLDTWADRLKRARERLAGHAELDPVVRSAAVAAVRGILIQGIGAFASRGRETTRVVWSAREVPPEAASTVVRHGEAFVYRLPSRVPGGQAAALYRPELAAQVWARGRARVLECPAALPHRPGAPRPVVGALQVDPAQLLAVNGDAIYTTAVPAWSLPTAHGGGDDGAVGRMRLQGWLGSVKLPATAAERNALRGKAEAAGVAEALAAAGAPQAGPEQERARA